MQTVINLTQNSSLNCSSNKQMGSLKKKTPSVVLEHVTLLWK